MAFIKLVVIGFVALTIIYFSLSVFSRSLRREKLEKTFAAENPGVMDKSARDAFVAAGMARYHASLRPRLIALVYVVPAVVAAAIAYFVNQI